MGEFPYVPLMTNTSPTRRSGSAVPIVPIKSAPYPDVKTTTPDSETVQVIKKVRTGAGGELSAIAMYLYQNNRVTNDDAIANAMLQIALVEMMHLDMLGDAIQAIGGKPTFDDGKHYWSAEDVNYADDIIGMVKADIRAEGGAIAGYEWGISRARNEDVRALFRRIIADERQHLRFFKDLLIELEDR